jgi:hypothetical protein
VLDENACTGQPAIHCYVKSTSIFLFHIAADGLAEMLQTVGLDDDDEDEHDISREIETGMLAPGLR